ncbi:MAG: murein biosynthesis integral membrane protein MurJ [Aggregatilineales bacterium]
MSTGTGLIENDALVATDAEVATEQPTQDDTNAQIAGATGILALGNILSRVLGLARETVLTFLFGATAAVDAFQVAIIIPKALYDLLIGGHVNGAIVPVLSEIVTLHGREELWRVLSILVSLLTAILLALLLVIQVFAPQIVQIAAGGADTATLALATDLLRFTSPALLFLGLFAIFSGTLYALKSFTFPALAGVTFNASIVLITLLFAPPYEIRFFTDFSPEYINPVFIGRNPAGISIVAFGWFIGAFMQFLIQLPGLKNARLRLSFDWRHPALRSIALLYAPVMFSLVMDTLIMRPFSYNLASRTGDGSIAYMNWSTTLIQFPQGLVATAISIAILPTLAGYAAQVTDGGLKAFKDTLGLGLRLATTLIIPATAGLFILATPIIALLFEHGAFTADMTDVTAQALRLYLFGLPFAAIDLLLVYAFYARKDTVTPALIGVFSLVVYMVIASAGLERFGLFSLMLADSAKHIVHAVISAVLLRRQLKGFGQQRLLITAFRTTIAAGVMVIIAMLTLPALTDIIGTQGILREALLVMVTGVLYGGIFIGLALLLKVEELLWLVQLIRQRLTRK